MLTQPTAAVILFASGRSGIAVIAGSFSALESNNCINTNVSTKSVVFFSASDLVCDVCQLALPTLERVLCGIPLLWQKFAPAVKHSLPATAV